MTYKIAILAFCIATAGPAIANETLNENHLATIDANADGSVSKEEYSNFSDFAFDKMDVDDSGTLDRTEFGTHLDGDAFIGLDSDGDGSISSGELSQQMMQDFDAADKDNDGILN